MKVKIKNTAETAQKLFKANVPTFVINGILGKNVEADDHGHVMFDWIGQHTTWSIPADCMEILVEQGN